MKAIRKRYLRVGLLDWSFWLAAAAAVVVCCWFSVGAEAQIVHKYLSTPQVQNEIPGPVGGPLEGANSMTFDQGDLWVAERAAGLYRTDEFNGSTGAFLSQLAQPPASVEHLEKGVAVRAVEGRTQVFVGGQTSDQAAGGVVAVFNGVSGAYVSAWSGEHTPAKSFGHRGVLDVAVDHSENGSDWARGDVLIADAAVEPSAPDTSVVDVFAPSGAENPEEVYVTQITGPSPTEHFEQPYRIAVSGYNGDVIVDDRSPTGKQRFEVFAPVGIGSYQFIGELAAPPSVGSIESVNSITVDGKSGNIYFDEPVRKVVYEYNVSLEFVGELSGEETPPGEFGRGKVDEGPGGLAVDPTSGNLFVGNNQNPQASEVDVFGPDLVIPNVETLRASGEVFKGPSTGWEVTFSGAVELLKEGAARCAFVWGESSGFGNTPASCSGEVTQASGKAPVQAMVSGLKPDTTYYYRLQATNHNGTNRGSGSTSFTTAGPGMLDEHVTEVSSSSASLGATVYPHDAPGGQSEVDFQGVAKSPTAYYFQYGTENTSACDSNQALCLRAPAGVANVGSGVQGVEVSQHVQGLLPGTAYHYRIVAINEANPASEPGVLHEFDGPDHAFTTQPSLKTTELALPDGRAWELVSPANKNGARIAPIANANLIQAASSGGAVSYVASGPFEANAYGGYLLSGAQVFSEHGPNGWVSRGIDLPHAVASGLSLGGDYEFFSEDLSLAVVSPFDAGGFTSMAPEAFPPDTERTPYLRHDSTCVSVPGQCYEPLATEAEGYSDVTAPKAEFGGTNSSLVQFEGASPDGTHVVVGAEVALLEHAPPGLYEWSAGAAPTERLTFLGVLPEDEQKSPGEAASGGSLGGGTLAVHAVSADGSRVFWTGGKPRQIDNLYMRDVAKGETIRLDLVEGRSEPTPAAPEFSTASSDGRYVFFTDRSPLTKDSGASFGAYDLYECEIVEVEVAGRLRDKCELRDLTPEPAGVQTGKREPADVQGVVGTSEDGSYVYFVANGSLGASAPIGTCNGRKVFANTCNLFVSHDGVASFIAALSDQDSNDWNNRSQAHTARVSPDGVWLAFMSDRSLTGYDNRDAVSGVPDEEVYLYNAETKRLVCASCDPTGARPVGAYNSDIVSSLAGGFSVWVGRWIAANIPGWTNYETGSALHQSRFLSNSGRLFFNSSDALVPLDINGTEDVYEFEPVGVGGASGCTTSSSTYSGVSGGCVSLVSSGASSRESAFLDASESGDDVFFLTFDRLVSSDVDSAVDVYDAHVCGSGWGCVAPVVAPPACSTADACRAAPSPQPVVFGAPASATFSGAGNATGGSGSQVLVSGRGASTRAQLLVRALRACRKHGLRSARAACEARARRRFAGRQASRRVRVHSRGVRRGRRGA